MLLESGSLNPASRVFGGLISLRSGLYEITMHGLRPVPGMFTVEGYTASPVEPGVLFRLRLAENGSLILERVRNGTVERSAPVPAGSDGWEPPVPMFYSRAADRLYVLLSEKALEYDPRTLTLLGERRLSVLGPWGVGDVNMAEAPWASLVYTGGTGLHVRGVLSATRYPTVAEALMSPDRAWQAISLRGHSPSLAVLGRDGSMIEACRGFCLFHWLGSSRLAYIAVRGHERGGIGIVDASRGSVNETIVEGARPFISPVYAGLVDRENGTLTLYDGTAWRKIQGVLDAYPLRRYRRAHPLP